MKRATVLLLIVWLSTPTARAQPTDSLENRLEDATGETRIDLLQQLHDGLRATDPVKALLFANEALELSEELQYTEGLIQANTNLGIYYRNLGDPRTSLTYLKGALSLQEVFATDASLALSLNELGITYTALGEFDNAFDSFRSAQDLALESSRPEIQAMILNNMGNVYLQQEETDQALNTYLRAQKVLEIYPAALHWSEVLTNIGDIYQGRKDYQKALQIYQLALQKETEQDRPNARAESLLNIGWVHLRMGNNEEAFTNLDRAAQISKAEKNTALTARIYESLAEVYFARNEPILAYLMLKRQNLMKDSLLQAENNLNIARVRALYELDESKLRALDSEIVTLQDENQKFTIIVVVLSAMVIVSVAIGAYRQLMGSRLR